MSAKFTSGPWTVCEHSWSRTGIYSARHGIAALDISDEANEDTQEQWEAVMRANARLIAAAPELLQALQALLSRHNDGSSEGPWAEWDTASEAVAKAIQS